MILGLYVNEIIEKSKPDFIKICQNNDDIRELVNTLKENRNQIASNISCDVDYYSFLKGFDYVLDEINYILNKE